MKYRLVKTSSIMYNRAIFKIKMCDMCTAQNNTLMLIGASLIGESNYIHPTRIFPSWDTYSFMWIKNSVTDFFIQYYLLGVDLYYRLTKISQGIRGVIMWLLKDFKHS